MSAAAILVGAMTAILIFFLVINSFQALLLMSSVPELWSHWQLADDEYFHALVGSESLPPISVVAALQQVPADVVAVAHTLLGLEYPRFEVILVVNGADGDMMPELADALQLYEVPPAFTVNVVTQPIEAYYRSRLYPRALCIDKRSGGLGDALNAGINAARYPHAVIVGPGVTFERDALLRLARPFLLDRTVACVGGLLRPASEIKLQDGRIMVTRARGWLMGCQSIEYLRLFMYQRLGWNRIASNLVFPGKTVLFRREHIFGIGGFDPETDVPGMDLAVRLHRYLTDTGVNATMPVIPDTVAWAVAPHDMATIGWARRRWVSALVRALGREKTMLANPEYGAFGVIAMPYLWLGIISAPVLELLGYVGLIVGLATGALDWSFAWAYLASVVGYGILLSVWTVVFQAISYRRHDQPGQILRLLAYAVIESLGYRQMMAWYRATAHFVERQPGNSNGQPSPAGAA